MGPQICKPNEASAATAASLLNKLITVNVNYKIEGVNIGLVSITHVEHVH